MDQKINCNGNGKSLSLTNYAMNNKYKNLKFCKVQLTLYPEGNLYLNVYYQERRKGEKSVIHTSFSRNWKKNVKLKLKKEGNK